MRTLLTIVAGLGLTTLAIAQNPAQPKLNLTPVGQNNPAPAAAAPAAPAPFDPANNRLDYLLQQWEQRMKSIQALEATVERTDTDGVEKTSKVYSGVARFRRPNQASLYLKRTTDPAIFEQFVFTGQFLFEVQSQFKRMNVHEVAVKPGQMVDDNFLRFLFGMSAQEAKQRYQMSIYKEDKNYIQLFIDPKEVADRQDFTRAKLALFGPTTDFQTYVYLPRELEFETPNGSRIKWDIKTCNPNAKFTANDFLKPEVPKDWQVIRVPRQAPGVTPLPQNPTNQPPPTKVRPNGG